MLILTKDIVMIVIKIIITQNIRKIKKVKTLFFSKKLKLQGDTIPNIAKPSTIQIKRKG